MENTLHGSDTCKAEKKIWQLSPMTSAIEEMGNADLLGDLMILQKKFSKVDLELLVTFFLGDLA